MDQHAQVSDSVEAAAVPERRHGTATLDRACLSAALAGLILTAASFLGAFWWLPELLTHFRLQFAIGAMALALWGLLRRRRLTAVVAALVVAVNLTPLVPYFLPGAAEAQAGQEHLRIMAVNVHLWNTGYTRLREAIRRDDPDIVGLMEANTKWVEEIASALPEHSWTVLRPEDGAYGLALFSRRPLKELPESPYVDEGIQSAIAVELDLQSAPTTLVLAHLKAPTGPRSADLRNAQISSIVTALRSDENDEQILIGDLNITPWSPRYAPLESEAGLTNAARGRGYVSTWPAWLPASFMRIPIDQCLVSSGLRVQQFRTGAHVGSDHLPIVADIALAAALPGESH